jgi:hypothetical protein
MIPLLQTPCYLCIYCDEDCYHLIYEIREQYKLNIMTFYVIESFETLECFKWNSIIKQNRLIYHPTKDERTCSESHLLCCNKFDFVLRTIEKNPFHTTKFGWIDSNVRDNFSKICENYKNNILLYILNNVSEKFHIQILNVCDKKYKQPENKREYYERYQWVVCGSFFTTGKEVGEKILKRLHKIFEETTQLGF